MNKKTENKKGFTLVEVLVYVGIFSISISAVLNYFFVLNAINNKNILMSKLENNSRFIFSVLENKIFDADDVTFPELGQASSSLILFKNNEDNLYFQEIDNGLYLKSGENIAHRLTSPDILINDLEFNVSGEGDKNIKISFLLENKKNNSKDFMYKRKFYNSFTTR